MRILIVGGTGFMGPFVVRQLAEQGHELLLFHRGRTHAELPSDITHLYGDRADLPAFTATFQSFAPDVTLDMRPLVERDARLEEVDYTPPIAREEGLRRTIDWERANPPTTVDSDQFDYAAEDAALAGRGDD